jgi:hypothetical protein
MSEAGAETHSNLRYLILILILLVILIIIGAKTAMRVFSGF